MMKHTALVILSLFVLFSCSVQKRKYQKGYYISWNNPAALQKEKRQQPDLAAQPVPATPRAKKHGSPVHQEMIRQLSSAPQPPETPVRNAEKKRLLLTDACDEIVFKDGREIKGKVTEVTQTEIKYKKCDMLDGPTYVVKKSEVVLVKYANGTRDVFTEEAKIQPNAGAPAYGVRLIETHHLAEAALVLGIASFITLYFGIVCAILAIVLGNKAIREIKAEPTFYDGLKAARVGIILGIIYLSLLILLIGILVFGLLLI